MAALNFVGYINATSSASAAEKARFLDDLCCGLEYSDTVKDATGNTVPNPETKTQFANRAIMEWLKATVRTWRYAVAYNAVAVDELNL